MFCAVFINSDIGKVYFLLGSFFSNKIIIAASLETLFPENIGGYIEKIMKFIYGIGTEFCFVKCTHNRIWFHNNFSAIGVNFCIYNAYEWNITDF